MSAPVTEARRVPSTWRPAQALGPYGLLLLTILLIIFFSVLLPSTFPTPLNLRAILSDKSIVAFLSLAAMIPLSTNKFDLSIGFGIGLAHILVIGLQVQFGVPWPLAVLAVLFIGLLVGTINGVLVEAAQIDSFIATLGTGSILYAISFAYTGGQQIVGTLPPQFIAINGFAPFGIPAPAIYVLALGVVLWLAFEFLPIGRYMYAIGSNPRAAELSGIPKHRYVILAFAASGLITALAGVVLGSKLQVGQANVGNEFLLPAFVGALLGSTAIKVGRVNVWGTLVAVAVLAVGISGIEQLGSSFFVEPLFNGTTLLIAVGLAGFAARRRVRAALREDERAMQAARDAASEAGESQTGTGKET
jgi:ribose transport system permease protein